MNSKAVIAVFCYKRMKKLEQCIEALLRNPEAKDSHIIFFSDGHRNKTDEEGVLSTRKYIDSITGFRSVEKQFRPKNIGLRENFKQGLEYVCQNYESFVVVEDDLVVSSNYLSFINEGLKYYRDQKEVFCVTGYSFKLNNIESYPFDAVVHYRLCVYGWGSWSDRVSKVNWDLSEIDQMVKNDPGFKPRLNKEGMDLHRMLLKTLDGRISTWDVLVQVHIAQHQLKVIYPIKSKSTNIGFDNESTHTFGLNYLKTDVDESQQRSFRFPDQDNIEPGLIKQLRKPYSLPELAKRKIYNTVKEKLGF